jgi:hypothetical protein
VLTCSFVRSRHGAKDGSGASGVPYDGPVEHGHLNRSSRYNTEVPMGHAMSKGCSRLGRYGTTDFGRSCAFCRGHLTDRCYLHVLV